MRAFSKLPRMEVAHFNLERASPRLRSVFVVNPLMVVVPVVQMGPKPYNSTVPVRLSGVAGVVLLGASSVGFSNS